MVFKKGDMVRMPLVRFWVGLAVFLPLAVFSGGTAYSGKADLLLARLQIYDPDLRIERLEKPAAVRDRQFIRALGSVATNLNEDWHIRIEAIRMLGATGDPAATDALMTELLDFCPAIRWNAANALGGFSDDPRVADALIASLHSDTMYIREAAIRSLGDIRSRSAVPHLIELLGSPNFAIKSSAIISLGEIGDANALPSLKRVAGQDAEQLLRNEAAAAVDMIEGRKRGL